MAEHQYSIEMRAVVKHDADAKLRRAYARLADWYNQVTLEDQKENENATSSNLRESLNTKSGKGSNNRKPVSAG